MNFRTDLTLERAELASEKGKGIKKEFKHNDFSNTTIIDILNEETAEKLGKAVGRYITIEIPELINTDRMSYIIPPVLKDKPELLAKYENAFKETAVEYERLKNLGIPEELLVYYQLSGNTLDIVTTMNARQLMLFMRLRSCTRAQWEIQEYAVDALKKLRAIEPLIFNFYGPSCFVSACPEGRMTCGRVAEIKEKFSNLK